MDNPVALLTAAGSGIGAAAARRLAAEGWRVAILSPSGRGEALAAELGGLGVTGSNQQALDLKRLVDGALGRWGRIDAVVNSAGHGPKGSRLAAFTKLYSDQYAAEGLRMNNVLPGFIDSLPVKAERRARIPMGRYGSADEVAELVAFLASHKSAYITGQNIRIDGGLTRSV